MQHTATQQSILPIFITVLASVPGNYMVLNKNSKL